MLAACGLIHLNPSWINRLLRELLDHRLADPKEASCLVEGGELSCKFLFTNVEIRRCQVYRALIATEL